MNKNNYIIGGIEKELNRTETIKDYSLIKEEDISSRYQLTISFSKETDRQGRNEIVESFISKIKHEFSYNDIQTKVLEHNGNIVNLSIEL